MELPLLHKSPNGEPEAVRYSEVVDLIEVPLTSVQCDEIQFVTFLLKV